jgi:hemerythrin
MALLSWDDGYSVGIKEIDEQHKELINLINLLYEAMSAGKGDQVLGEIMERLVIYTQTHFVTEERLMVEYQFPGYAEHKAEHDDLIGQVAIIHRQYKEGAAGLTMQILIFLEDWLVEHILGVDQLYKAFLLEKGVH